MRALTIGAALAALSLNVAVAQTAPATQNGAAPGTAAGSTSGMMNGGASGTHTMGSATAPAMNGGGAAAALGNNNQAVATTNTNAPQPAKGHNSFTAGQARTRIERNGYQKVAGLKKDTDGVWHGTAQKDGQQSNVWLDYKGNVGSSAQ